MKEDDLSKRLEKAQEEIARLQEKLFKIRSYNNYVREIIEDEAKETL
jgi:hypothetical protein